MMYVDKNADGHVMDQNGDRILGEIAYVPFGERIRSKRSSCMQLFFFFFTRKKWAQDMLTNGHDKMRISVMLFRGPTILNFGCASQRSKDLNFGRAFQRSDEFKVWTCFPKVQELEFWQVLPRGPLKLNFGRASQRSKDLNFGCASQRSDGFEVWTYYVEVWSICGRWYLCQCVWVLYPSSDKINIFN